MYISTPTTPTPTTPASSPSRSASEQPRHYRNCGGRPHCMPRGLHPLAARPASVHTGAGTIQVDEDGIEGELRRRRQQAGLGGKACESTVRDPPRPSFHQSNSAVKHPHFLFVSIQAMRILPCSSFRLLHDLRRFNPHPHPTPPLFNFPTTPIQLRVRRSTSSCPSMTASFSLTPRQSSSTDYHPSERRARRCTSASYLPAPPSTSPRYRLSSASPCPPPRLLRIPTAYSRCHRAAYRLTLRACPATPSDAGTKVERRHERGRYGHEDLRGGVRGAGGDEEGRE
ncbi:hypothetical protein R3P38DRAFT_3238585 [Favolaschia claudopus]|uniref:Uncharacterized protein n=1 Tax=Favolaschia claudopus TaxID=2862362 RepID=A0AAV9Z9E1_9AGAR